MTIKIQQAIWWHAAVFSPAADAPSFDPTSTTGGMSSLRLDGTPPVGIDPRYFTSASPGVLAGKFCDTLRSFSLSVTDTNLDGEVDTVVDHPSFGVRMGDPTLLDSRVIFNPTAVEAQAVFGAPKLVVKLEDFVTARVPLSYMLMAVYNSGLSLQCSDRTLPDEWFTHDTIPGTLVDPVSSAELQAAMEPVPQRTSDGLDAGFFVQFAAQQDVRQLGCCGVVVGGGGSSSSSSTGGPATGQCVGGPTLRAWQDTPSRTRIWAVRAGIRGSVSPALSPTWSCFGPTPQELVYAEFDDDTKLDTAIDSAVITWHHAGFVVLEDNHGLMFPTDFSGTSADDSINLGSAYDYQRRLPVDIVDIAWDDRGWLWGMCTGPSRTEGTSTSSPESTVDGIYRILPGGWSYQRADTISFGGHFAGESVEVTSRLVESRMGGFAKVSCGDGYTLYLTTDGHLEFISQSSTPANVPPSDVMSPTQVVLDIAASSTHAACVLADGTLRVWSMGGTGDYIDLADATPNMLKVACGDGLTCAIGTDGNIHAFGAAFSPPEAAAPVSPFVSIDCGTSHIAGMTEDGRMVVTGSYSDATDAAITVNNVTVFACGDDCTIYTDSSATSQITYLGPTGSSLANPPIASGMDVYALAAAERHAVALAKSSGCSTCSAYALPWGDNSTTETGMALTRNQSPISLDGQDQKFVSVSCGKRHTCLITDGTLLEPRYAPARLIYRSKISLAAGVDVPDEPAAVMVDSSNSGSPLASVSVYDDSTIILGDSTSYSGNPFDFSERVGLKIYDGESRTVRVLSANWRPHRLRVGVTDANKLTDCQAAELTSASHLLLPPTSDLSVSDHLTGDPSLLTVMQLPESAGSVNSEFSWKLDAASFATRIYANAGSSAAVPQARPVVVSGSSSGAVLGMSLFTGGGYSAGSAMMPQFFIPGSDLISTLGSQVFMRNEGVDSSTGSGSQGWAQTPSICPYIDAFDNGNSPVGYSSCSVGREYLLPPDGGSGGVKELSYLSSAWRIRAAIPKTSIDTSQGATFRAPFTSDDAGISDSIVNNDYAADPSSFSTPSLADYAIALGPRSLCMAAPNRYPIANSTCLPSAQWVIAGTTIPCFGGTTGTSDMFISAPMSNTNGFSRAEKAEVVNVAHQFNLLYSAERKVDGCDLVDSRETALGTLCASVALGTYRYHPTSSAYDREFSIIETRWLESSNGSIVDMSTATLARRVEYVEGGIPRQFIVDASSTTDLMPEIKLLGSQAGAFILRKQLPFSNSPASWRDAEILYLPKDPDASISTDVAEPRVLAASAWDRVAESISTNIMHLMVADGGAQDSPFLGWVVAPQTGGVFLRWTMGQGGRFSGTNSFATLWANALSQNITPFAGNVELMCAQFVRRNDSTSDVIIVHETVLMYKPFGATQFTVVTIGSTEWNALAPGLPMAIMHSPGGDRLVVARADNNRVNFFSITTDQNGHPSDVSPLGFYLHGFNENPILKASGSRLLLQFSTSPTGDPRHLVLDIGEVEAAAATALGGELKAASLLHAQPSPLRVSVNSDDLQTAAPFMYFDGAVGGSGASVIYPQSAGGGTGTMEQSLPDERLGAFASMPSSFHPQSASGSRFLVENTNKAFRVYEVSSAGLTCNHRITDSATLQGLAPGSLNDLMSFASYRSNQKMSRLSPWGNPYSSICGVYGRVGTQEQRILMVGDRLYVMSADGSIGSTSASRAMPLPTPVSWITEINARAADLTVSGAQVTAQRPERFGGVSPYRRVKTRQVIDSTLTIPFGGATPISVRGSVAGSDMHAWAYWGSYLFRLGVSGTNVTIGQPVNVPTGSGTPFSTWFLAQTGAGSPTEVYSDFLDGYVTSASSAAGLVIANSRCWWDANISPAQDLGRMEIRVFSYASGSWSHSQTLILNDPIVMGGDVGVKYHEDSYLPQRLSMALSADGRLLAVAGHRWTVGPLGIPQNTQVVVFKRETLGFTKALVINSADVSTDDILGDFASHLEMKDEGGGVYTLNISCALDPLSAGGNDIASMAARNRMVSYRLDVNGSLARVSECNDLLPAGELGFLNSAAANLNHWVASPSPAYNGVQSAAWTGSKLTITTLNRLMSLQSDRANWRITDHLARPYRYTDAKVLATDFAAYSRGFTCPSTAASCSAVTDVPQLPSPAGGYTALDGRVRASFFVPPALTPVNDTGFYQVDNSGGVDKGWWDGIGSDSQLSSLPELSHIATINRVPRSTAAGEAYWNPSTQGAIRIVPLSGAGAGVPTAVGGGFGCTVRRPLFAAKAGVNRLDWPHFGALQVKPKHLVRFQDEATSLRSTAANNLDLIDAGTISLTRNAANVIVMKDAIDRAAVAGAAIPTVAPTLWSDITKNAEDLGQLVSLRITGGVAQVRGYTTEGIFPETAGSRVSSSSQRFGIKRPMSVTVGGNSVCGAGSFDIARPARSAFAPLEGRAGGRGASPWLMLFERHGIDSIYFSYAGADFGTRGINLTDPGRLRRADPFMVSPQAPFDPIGHIDRMGWCSNACYPLGGNATSISEAIVDMVRGVFDPDNGSIFNGDRMGLGTTDGYSLATAPTDYSWAFPDPVGGFGTTVRCLCKSTVFDAYEWIRKTFRLSTAGVGSKETALRVLHGAGAVQDPTAPFYTRFNEDGNPLRSLIFVLTVDSTTGNSAVLDTPMGSSDPAILQVWAESVFSALRTADIIEANGSIHFIDMVKRDLSDPYRRACETLAEVSGGSYISLGRQWPTAPT